MRRWIVFKADKRQPNWKERKLQHTGSLTDILAEHFDSSSSPLPEPGYRPPEFIRVEQFSDSQYPAAKTHYRKSDWEVVRVETYEHGVGRPYAEYDVIVICYCQYSPINAPLNPMPERQVSVDSFGGDKEAYERWKTKEQDKTVVTTNCD